MISTLETLHLSGPFIQEGSVPSQVTEWLGVGVGEKEHQAGSQEFWTLPSVWSLGDLRKVISSAHVSDALCSLEEEAEWFEPREGTVESPGTC